MATSDSSRRRRRPRPWPRRRHFQLTPPEVITPVPAEVAPKAVPLPPETAKAVDDQVARFIDALMTENVHSPEFKAKLDSAFALGREEISNAAGLMQGRFLQRNFIGAEDSPAYKAIGEIRGLLDTLNPGNEGDLLAAEQDPRHHPLRQQAQGLLPQVRERRRPAHQVDRAALRRARRRAARHRRHRRHPQQALGGDAEAGRRGAVRDHARRRAWPSGCRR